MSAMAIFHQVTKLRRDHTARFYFSKVRILLSQSSLSTIPVMSRLSWKWRKRSSVKIAERTYEKRAQALHC